MTTTTATTIMITGSRGFMAPHLIRALRRTHPKARLIAVHRAPVRGHVACDLRDAAATRRLIARFKPALIYHLAGTTKPVGWNGMWQAHVQTTLRLLEAARLLPKSRRPRLVISGSSAEYGTAAGSKPINEESSTLPATPYGATKLAQTLAALSYRERGMDVVVARIFNAVGPGIPDNLAPGAFARQIARIERGLQPARMSVGNLASVRDFIDVRDVAEALIELGSPLLHQPLYNVCSGRGVPIRGILRGLVALSKASIQVANDPTRMTASDLPRVVGDGRRLAAAAWKPAWALDQTLKDALEWHRSLIDQGTATHPRTTSTPG